MQIVVQFGFTQYRKGKFGLVHWFPLSRTNLLSIQRLEGLPQSTPVKIRLSSKVNYFYGIYIFEPSPICCHIW